MQTVFFIVLGLVVIVLASFAYKMARDQKAEKLVKDQEEDLNFDAVQASEAYTAQPVVEEKPEPWVTSAVMTPEDTATAILFRDRAAESVVETPAPVTPKAKKPRAKKAKPVVATPEVVVVQSPVKVKKPATRVRADKPAPAAEVPTVKKPRNRANRKAAQQIK